MVRPAGAGHLRVMPGDETTSSSSTINWATGGDVIANGLTVRVDAQRKVRVFNSSGAPVHFLLDVVGYYSATGSQFYLLRIRRGYWTPESPSVAPGHWAPPGLARPCGQFPPLRGRRQ